MTPNPRVTIPATDIRVHPHPRDDPEIVILQVRNHRFGFDPQTAYNIGATLQEATREVRQ